MTSEHLEDDVGTGLKCHTFGSLALTSTKVQHWEVVYSVVGLTGSYLAVLWIKRLFVIYIDAKLVANPHNDFRWKDYHARTES